MEAALMVISEEIPDLTLETSCKKVLNKWQTMKATNKKGQTFLQIHSNAIKEKLVARSFYKEQSLLFVEYLNCIIWLSLKETWNWKGWAIESFSEKIVSAKMFFCWFDFLMIGTRKNSFASFWLVVHLLISFSGKLNLMKNLGKFDSLGVQIEWVLVNVRKNSEILDWALEHSGIFYHFRMWIFLNDIKSHSNFCWIILNLFKKSLKLSNIQHLSSFLILNLSLFSSRLWKAVSKWSDVWKQYEHNDFVNGLKWFH